MRSLGWTTRGAHKSEYEKFRCARGSDKKTDRCHETEDDGGTENWSGRDHLVACWSRVLADQQSVTCYGTLVRPPVHQTRWRDTDGIVTPTRVCVRGQIDQPADQSFDVAGIETLREDGRLI